MTRIQQFAVAVLVACVAATTLYAQQSTPPQTGQAKAQVITLVGCVDRVLPSNPTTTPPAKPPAPTFKLTGVQPGTGTTLSATMIEKEYLIVGPETLPFSKYHNQWVEVTGTIVPVTPPATPPPAGQMKPAAMILLPTFNVTELKVVSTECKG